MHKEVLSVGVTSSQREGNRRCTYPERDGALSFRALLQQGLFLLKSGLKKQILV